MVLLHMHLIFLNKNTLTMQPTLTKNFNKSIDNQVIITETKTSARSVIYLVCTQEFLAYIAAHPYFQIPAAWTKKQSKRTP